MKSPGIRLGLNGSMRVVMPTRVEDKVWDAVREAIDAGWTPQQFRYEIADAWEEHLRDDAKAAKRALA